MRSFGTRLAVLWLAAVGYVVASPGVGSAEVGGFHLNLTPFGGLQTYDSGVNLQDKFLYGGRVGLGFGKYIGIEGSYGRSSTNTQQGDGLNPWTVPGSIGSTADATFQHIAADLNLNLVPNATIDPYLLGGWSQAKIDPEGAPGGDKSYSGLNYGGGLKLHFSPRTALRLEGRNVTFGFDDEDETAGASDKTQNNLQYTGGLLFALGGDAGTVDTDADGVTDKKDQCPNTPAGCVVDANGCPIDSDGDGVCDGVDVCPNTPSGVTVDPKGCPNDSDGDGVADGPDTCPNTPAGCQVDANGCPVDSDRDGVCDGLDQCANTQAGCRVDERGCPVDTDGDGVCDGLDNCPNTPAGARVDKDGCPIEISTQEMEMLEKGQITSRKILFDTGKSTLKPESEAELRTLCGVLQQWPTLQIEIGGHTDSQGSAAFNQKLSEERAQAVREWAQANCPGLTPGNYTFKGYGETKPVGKNSTAAGRAQNRRVEFKVMNPEELKRLKERRETLMKESQGK
ncbi:MAG: OmpA family protein [Candidatus Eiseniibacteriota bacterium]